MEAATDGLADDLVPKDSSLPLVVVLGSVSMTSQLGPNQDKRVPVNTCTIEDIVAVVL